MKSKCCVNLPLAVDVDGADRDVSLSVISQQIQRACVEILTVASNNAAPKS